MRAINHLGFSGAVQTALSVVEIRLESRSGRHNRINVLRRTAIKHCTRCWLPKFLLARINQLQASQNAAALLFDVRAVDMFAEWGLVNSEIFVEGVPSKAKLIVEPLRATMNRAQV